MVALAAAATGTGLATASGHTQTLALQAAVSAAAQAVLTSLFLGSQAALGGTVTATSSASATVWVGLLVEFIRLDTVQLQRSQCRATLLTPGVEFGLMPDQFAARRVDRMLAPDVSFDLKTPRVHMELKL